MMITEVMYRYFGLIRKPENFNEITLMATILGTSYFMFVILNIILMLHSYRWKIRHFDSTDFIIACLSILTTIFLSICLILTFKNYKIIERRKNESI